MSTHGLILISPALPGGRVELNAHTLPAVIGRSHSADITISDPQLSRRHAEIRIDGAGRFELADLHSTNLTIVNTHDVSRHILSNGDRMVLGDTEILVQVDLPHSDLQDHTTKDLPLIG